VTDEPFDLTAYCPAECPHGHVLRYGGREDADFIPGRVQVSFATCTCPQAEAKGGAWGHQSVECSACRAEGRVTLMLDPPAQRDTEDAPQTPILSRRYWCDGPFA
jgi:hypothetical protein